MPRNFLEGCEAVEELLDDVDITPDELDQMVTQAHISPNSSVEELKPVQDRTGIDSISVIAAAEAAETCQVCQDLGQCTLGQFLSTSTSA